MEMFTILIKIMQIIIYLSRPRKSKKAVMSIKQAMSFKHTTLQRKIREILRRFVFLIWIPLPGNWCGRQIKTD